MTVTVSTAKWCSINGVHYYTLTHSDNITPVDEEYSEYGTLITTNKNSYTEERLSLGLYLTNNFTNIWSHLLTGSPASLSINKGYKGQSFNSVDYSGCIIQKLGLNFPAAGWVECMLDIEAKSHIIGSNSYIQPSNLPFHRGNISYSWGNMILECSIQVEREVSSIFTIDSNSKYRQHIPFGLRRVTGNISFYLTDYTTINDILNNTDKSLIITITGGPTITLPKIRLKTYNLNAPQEAQPQVLTVPFKAIKDTSGDIIIS